MTTEPNTAQSIVDGQLAELQITSAEVTGDTYKEQHDAKIRALADEEAALPTPTDKASLQAVQDFITKSERARTGIDKWRKAFKDQWKKIIDPVDAYIGTSKESGMQARIYAIQERAEAKKKAYLDEQAKAQREAERLLEERYTARVAKLTGAGMTFDAAGNLTIRDGEQTLSALPAQLRFATDEQMAAVLAKVETIRTAQIEREEAARQAKEAEEREAQEMKDRLAQQKREQDEAAAKLKAEREAFEKERAEHAAKVKAIEEQKERERRTKLQEDRRAELIAMGATANAEDFLSIGVTGIAADQLGWHTSDSWAGQIARFKEAAEARDNQPSVTVADEAGEVPQAAVEAIQERVASKQEGSAVVGAQPDLGEDLESAAPVQTLEVADELDAEATAWVIEPFDIPEEKAQWENSDWFIRCKLAYIAGYRAHEREMYAMNDGE